MRKALVLAVAMQFGCATLQPSLGDSCRDPATGRYTVCSSGGGDTTTTLIVLGVLAGVGALGALVYYASRPQPVPATPTTQ